MYAIKFVAVANLFHVGSQLVTALRTWDNVSRNEFNEKFDSESTAVFATIDKQPVDLDLRAESHSKKSTSLASMQNPGMQIPVVITDGLRAADGCRNKIQGQHRQCANHARGSNLSSPGGMSNLSGGGAVEEMDQSGSKSTVYTSSPGVSGAVSGKLVSGGSGVEAVSSDTTSTFGRDEAESEAADRTRKKSDTIKQTIKWTCGDHGWTRTVENK